MSTTLAKDRSDFRVLIVYPNLPLMLVPGIAIGLFTRICRDQGYAVDMFDTTHYDTEETNYSEIKINYSENRAKILNARKFDVARDLGIAVKSSMLSDFRDKVLDFAPDLMVFSVVEDTYLQALSMLHAVADLDVPHLFGGVFPTMAPEVCMEAPEIRLIGLGEGETSVVAVAEALRQGLPLEGIAGTWFKSADGEVVRTPQPPLVDINLVRPDFSLFADTRFNRPMGGRVFRTVPIETYRGCPYNCTYCNSPAQRGFTKLNGLGNFLRRKTMDNMRAELAEIRDRFRPEFIMFMDDSFMARPRAETFEFCDMYEEFRIPFYFNTRPENCDADTLKRLEEVGCYRIAFGIEHGNQQFRRNVLRRKPTNEDIVERFRIIADSGISFSLNLIIGFPGETRELVMDTVELARAIRGYDTLTTFIFTPYHGTPLRRVAVDNGWLDPAVITKHNTSRSLLRMPPPYLNADDIDGLMATVPLYCYFPKSEWESLRRAEAEDEEGLAVRKHYTDIYSRNFLEGNQDTPKVHIDAELTRPPVAAITVDRLDGAELDRLTRPMIGI